MTKVAFCVDTFPSQPFITNQIVGLLDAGFEVDVYALRGAHYHGTDEKNERYNLSAKTKYVPMPISKAKRVLKSGPYFLGTLSMNPMLTLRALDITRYEWHTLSLRTLYAANAIAPKATDYDIIHAHLGPVGKTFQFWSDSTDIPYIVSFYGYDASAKLDDNPDHYEELFGSVNTITVLSDDMQEQLRGFGCPNEKIVKQQLAIDLSKFPYTPRERIDDSFEIFSAGRLVEKKGFKYAIEALNELSDDYHITYRIAGDGPLRDELRTDIVRYGLEDTVELLGWQSYPEVQEHMARADIFVAPSVTASNGNKEGTPTVLLEAQASGLPVVSTFHAGIPEIVDIGESGLLVPERESGQLADAIEQLLQNPDRWSEMGKRGREIVETTHALSAMSERLKRIYNKHL